MTSFKADKIWFNGKMVDWADATVHVLAHALHYGSSWFEGIRCYATTTGPQVFRLREHVDRLYASCKIYRTEIPFSPEELLEAILETIRVNKLGECYIRPLAFRGAGTIGVNPKNAQVETIIIAAPWGRYLGDEGLKHGVDVGISSWRRPAPNTFPTMSKAGGNYLNSALIISEANLSGYAEGIALNPEGFVSEGSGENIFVAREGQIYTPPLSASILPGITRNSIITLAREAGFEVLETSIPREMLYIADEVFMTGTAAEVTPIRSVDRIPIGTGDRGEITAQIQQAFFDYAEGRSPDRFGWLTPVHSNQETSAPVGDS